MSKKTKYYVVWKGRTTGIFDTWELCKAQVDGVEGAKYKSFESRKEAEIAFASPAKFFAQQKTAKSTVPKQTKIIKPSLSVDAACSGNPGIMEYRGVDTSTGEQIFHQGPFPDATNNIGEFLALVHGLAYLQKHQLYTMPIYSDSRNAILWIKNKACKTKLEPSAKNKQVFELIRRGEEWLRTNQYQNPILKWETQDWGEIPADFGRK